MNRQNDFFYLVATGVTGNKLMNKVKVRERRAKEKRSRL